LAAVYAVSMCCGPIYNVVQLSRRLAMIPDGLQGRVNAAFRLFANALYPLGALLCGWLLEHSGAAVAVGVFAGVMALVAGGAAASRVVRREGLAPG
jgi:hypothetical protein